MAKQQEAPVADGSAPAEPKGGRRRVVVAALAVVAIAAGGLAFTTGTLGGDRASASGASADAPAPEPGEVVALSPVTLNLADGRFLKVGLALQLVKGAGTVDKAAVGGFAAPALDEAISVLGDRTYAELVAPGGRDAVKQALSERIATRYEGDVTSVYFTEFVMQ